MKLPWREWQVSMEQPSSNAQWEAYEDEFRHWLDATIEELETRLENLKQIREKLNHEKST